MNKQAGQPLCATKQGLCVAYASKAVSSKWTPMLLYALHNGACRFGELQAASGGVNPRTLSARLNALEREGIIHKAVYPETPPRTEYGLTDKGRDLLPIIESMIAWGQKYAA